MKTTLITLAFFFGIFKNFSFAQVSEPTNAITNTGSYVGTSVNKNINFKRNLISAGLISTTSTSFGLNSFATANSAAFGINSGLYSSGSGFNTYLGQDAGKGQSATTQNSGSNNTFTGYSSGLQNTTGSNNVFLGSRAGLTNISGSNNVYLGYNVGFEESNDASGNVFIGNLAGFSEPGSNKLVIGNYETVQLIWGDFAAEELKLNGKVAIGGTISSPFGNYPTSAGGVDVTNYNLFVKGGILTEEVRVSTTWADYVFNKDYNLKPLSEVEKFINDNGHLPNVPSATQVKEEGIELGDMTKIQQEKIEELTLYIIEQNKINEKQTNEIEQLKKILMELVNKK